MNYDSFKLTEIADKVTSKSGLTPGEISYLLRFKTIDRESIFTKILKNSALPLSLLLGFLIAVYPEFFDDVAATSPKWSNLSPRLLSGVDYFWDILGDPVGKRNLIFHLPNIVFYSFGVLGIKKLFDSLNRRTWLDNVLDAQKKLKQLVLLGKQKLMLNEGSSVLFTGRGDFIGMQFVLDHKKSQAVTVSEIKPHFTDIWNYYDLNTGYTDLIRVLKRISSDKTGEYMFFPVKDDQIFLPSEKAYDLPPHKLDIVCSDIRNIENKLGWSNKRIIIVGDKYHRSYVRSEDRNSIIGGSDDVISLTTISQKYVNTTLIDPTDIVLKKILEIAGGRKIVFRATEEGLREYKSRFYSRIGELGYGENDVMKDGILTIGYDLLEDQTEQQTLSRKVDDYYPVVLSKTVYDSLRRNGYKKEEFLYVPSIVLDYIKYEASLQ